MTSSGTGTTVVKLGGSVVTDKDRDETLDADSLETAADAVATALGSGDVEDLVIVHGGGSFGHVHASEHGVSTTDGTHDVGAVHAIHGAMKTLDEFVLQRLLERDVPAVPVHPFSVASRDAEGRLDLPTAPVETMLAEGFVPVLHGDVVSHRGEGVTIVSGDELIVELATALEAERVGLCSTVPGVLDDTGDVIERIEDYADVEAVLGTSESTDVTGGMAAKVQALLALESRASIFGLESLPAFFRGEGAGTTIES
ncbi:isopentenyl phosphate kinase [Natronosalvus rutilus]|uniref:Isopentenyl phosphate kinase n=1 Tax=Natronosalvus rutilus TaxID=2953753 RepID=A0A9E7NC18_9EURY|nr:isopentenyl phosphate kinase [Natronosalvus rutilus]UTF55140.1 isopentenyl phosphate kinase [Natronosalvus rutilus]